LKILLDNHDQFDVVFNVEGMASIELIA